MRKKILILFLLTAFIGISCEQKGLTQTSNKNDLQPSPTVRSNERPSKEFLDHYNAGLKLQIGGKFPEDVTKAVEEFKKAAEIKPDDKETYRRIVELYISVSKYEEAEVYLRKILEVDSEDGIAHWTLAQILVEHLGKYEEGLREIAISEKLYGNDGLSYVRSHLMGKAYDGLGENEKAVKQYKIFLKESGSPDANDYKEVKKRIFELEKIIQNSKPNG
jgi:tetratricopeptide (TPR) repeat protein